MSLVAFAFDVQNSAAVSAARDQAARLITRKGVTGQARKAIRQIIVDTIKAGHHPYEAARKIREMVGMNAPQAAAALNYESRLRRKGLSEARVNRLVRLYAARKIRERAETIARFEIMDALNRGAREAADQAVKAGLLGKGAKKGWSLSKLGRACPNCVAMSKLRIPLKAKFPYPDGRKLDGPPGHGRCRCGQTIYPE